MKAPARAVGNAATSATVISIRFGIEFSCGALGVGN
jgi:hypothetical protein